MSAEDKDLTFTFVPQLERSVWVKKEVITKDIEAVDGALREMVWLQFYYSDSQTGPWTFLTEQPSSFLGVSGI